MMANSRTRSTYQNTSRKTSERLALRDYLALYQMSLRRFFWQVDGRQAAGQFRMHHPIIWLASRFIAYLPILSIVNFIIFGIPGLLILLALPGDGFGILDAAGALVSGLLDDIIWFFIIFNPDKLKYNLRFRKSAWWRNTRIRPSEIKRDKGLYGEYMATVMAEQCLRRNGVYGRILNSVIVPKRDGDFTEIDLVCVNECGIHVFEVKARGGAFYGGFTDQNWLQRIGREEYTMENPVVQNQNHINFLLEYLSEVLPEGSTRRKAVFPQSSTNVVLFANLGVEYHIVPDSYPSTSYFCGNIEGRGGYQYCNLHSISCVQFTKDEVDTVADALEDISFYTRDEIARMMFIRKQQYDSGRFSAPAAYFYAVIESPDPNGETAVRDVVCRQSRKYRTYLVPGLDPLFLAVPDARITSRGPVRTSLDAAVDDYRRMTGWQF